jgi:Transposase
MPMPAESVDAVIGVDSHTDTHTACLLDPTGREIATVTMNATPGGYTDLLAWAVQQAPGPRLIWAVEGYRSHGAGLLRVLLAAGQTVVEAGRPQRASRRPGGKSDTPRRRPAQCGRHWGGQGPDQDAVVDDVRQVAVQPQGDAVTGQGLADADVAAGEGDQAGGIDAAVDLPRRWTRRPHPQWSAAARWPIVGTRRDGLRPIEAGSGTWSSAGTERTSDAPRPGTGAPSPTPANASTTRRFWPARFSPIGPQPASSAASFQRAHPPRRDERSSCPGPPRGCTPVAPP